jgi:hypothetical protein
MNREAHLVFGTLITDETEKWGKVIRARFQMVS